MKIISLSYNEIHRGTLILVNGAHAFDESAVQELIPIHSDGDALLQSSASHALNRLMSAVRGWQEIAFVSAWRSRGEQQRIWDDSLRENGPEFTRTYVALPGHSEHETGLAIDLGARKEHIDFIRPEFPYTGVCGTFREKAADYGFVLRYPKGREQVTGIGHEPWHFRYVGIPHARIMREQDMTLEEYTDYLRRFPYKNSLCFGENGGQKAAISYIEAQQEPIRLELPDHCLYTLSGNNVDGFILTEWR